MSWLMTQNWVELLIALVLGGLAGWGLHLLYLKGTRTNRAAGQPEGGGAQPLDSNARIAELEGELSREREDADLVRRKAGIQRPGEEGPLAEGSLMWRNRHLESRVRFLEGKLADLETDGAAARPAEDQNDEATRLRWRNRYLEGRVKYLEEELVRTGGLTPGSAAPAVSMGEGGSSRVKASEGDKPELFDAPRDIGADDLKMISGIGPKLEQKLNSIGIWHYSQVASWTQSEVDWVNAAISFRGRIERERWVTQARALLEGATPATTVGDAV
jgi:predicted flap endonuclease-1-like 5' DNA nuclease